MRKLKGITINGEWLGDNVVINGLFRAICAISPMVMLEFIKIVNSIEKLDEAVRINKFSFPNNNSIEIEFSNNSVQGLADLYFYLDNNVPKLADSKLQLKALGGAKEEICEIEEPKNEELSIDLEEKKEEDIEEKEDERKEIFQNNNHEKEYKDVEEISEIETTEVLDNLDYNNELLNVDETTSKEDVSCNTTESVTEEKDEKTPYENHEIESYNTEDIINRFSNLSSCMRPIQIQLIQTNEQPVQTLPEEKQEEEEEEKREEVVVEEETIQCSDSKGESNEDTAEISEPMQAENDSIIENDINKEDKFENNIKESATSCEEIQPSTYDSPKELENLEISKDSMEPEESSAFTNIETYNIEEEDEEEEEEDDDDDDEKTNPENLADNSSETENIEECLSEFYDEKNLQHIEEKAPTIDEKLQNEITIQAMLNEVNMLKEELNKLKSEQPKFNPSKFWSDDDKQHTYIEDEDADFRIMANGARLNASILDEDLFIAGDKLYRWGETLYLDE